MNKELIARLRVGARGWLMQYHLNDAADAIEALQAAATEYQKAADKMAMEHKVERDTLRQQLTEDQRDAERYRSLFKDNQPSSQFARAYARWDGSDGKAGFDAAIDAAMKGAA